MLSLPCMGFLFTLLGPSNTHGHPQAFIAGEDIGFLSWPQDITAMLSIERTGSSHPKRMAHFSKTLKLDLSGAGPFCFLHVLWK